MAQEQPDVLQRPMRVMTMAAIAVQVPERRALRRGARGDPRRPLPPRLGQADDQALFDEEVEIDLAGPGRPRMQRARIAVWRELQCAEAQDLAPAALVAGFAVAEARNRV